MIWVKVVKSMSQYILSRLKILRGHLPMNEDVRLVADIMTRDIRTLDRNDKLSIAEDVMKQDRIRHMPVLDSDGKLCGIMSQRDLFRGILLRSLGYGSRLEEKMLDSHPVKEAMIEAPYTTTPGTPAKDAARKMMEHKVGCLPVVDDDKLVGILTEGDFVKMYSEA